MAVAEKDVASPGMAGIHQTLVGGVGGVMKGAVTDGGGNGVSHAQES